MIVIRLYRKLIRLAREKYVMLQQIFYFSNKQRIFIYDQIFPHSLYSNPFYQSAYIHWDRLLDQHQLKIFTDKSLQRSLEIKGNKMAWLLESPAIIPEAISWIRLNYAQFRFVFTHNRQLLELDERFHFVPVGGTWLKKKDWRVWNKSRLISIISSGKNKTIGHKLRHKIIKSHDKKMDIYGYGYNPIQNKISGLRDYMFSFAIENIAEDFYFTEKIIDCFLTGTIPIYYGCPSIGNFFNEKGIIRLNSVSDLDEIFYTISRGFYTERSEYIKENFMLAQKYIIAEDYMYSSYQNIFMNLK